MPARPRTEVFSDQAALFGEKVRAARRERGLSQLKLAEVANVSFRQIQNIEANRNNERGTKTPQPGNPKLDTIYQLAEALEVDVTYLVDPSRPVESVKADS